MALSWRSQQVSIILSAIIPGALIPGLSFLLTDLIHRALILSAFPWLLTDLTLAAFSLLPDLTPDFLLTFPICSHPFQSALNLQLFFSSFQLSTDLADLLSLPLPLLN